MNACRFVLIALGLAALAPTSAFAQKRYTGYYSAKYQARGYSYRTYKYYSPKYRSYRMHYAIYYPRNRYVYYYNPYAKKYWGRYDTLTGRYAKLADKDKAGLLSQIPESAFPPGGDMPEPEPGAGGLMLPPPESIPPSGTGNGGNGNGGGIMTPPTTGGGGGGCRNH